jgi:2-amino-4-hydroxy-6-hydroxymethyldihydropteridine diphosphokinase
MPFFMPGDLTMDAARIALGLGANLGQPEMTFHRAAELLRAAGMRDLRLARCCRSAPVDCLPGIPDFTNSAAVGLWPGSPEELLAVTQGIEQQLGRPPEHDRRDSRSIDIDILLFADRCVQCPHLCIPHPRLRQRLFVLQPLAELAPDWPVPPEGISVAEALAQLLSGGS